MPYRPLVPAACAFAAGIALREYGALPAWAGWGGVLLWAAAFPTFRALGRVRVAALALGLLIAGLGWLRLDETKAPLAPDHVARSLTLEPRLAKLGGVIDTDPQAYASPPAPLATPGTWLGSTVEKTRFELDVRRVWSRDGWEGASGRVRVTVYGPPADLRYGDEVAVVGRARRPPAATNPGQLDLERLLAHRGVHALMTTAPGAVRVTDHHRGGPLRTVAYAARGWFRHLLRESLAHDATTASMLCATVLGDRTALDDELEADFQHSGTMHLLAISGLHVGVVAWMVWAAASLAGLRRETAGGIVLATVVLYALATGMAPSVVRAALVTAAVVGSIVGRRQYDPLQATALAALVLLACNPADLFHVGFQLSFAAVVAILTLHAQFISSLRPERSLLERITPRGDESALARAQSGWLRRIRSCFAVSLAAWLGTMPLTARVYNTFSPVTVLANLIAVPILAGVLVLGFAHALLAVVSTAAAALPGLLARVLTQALAWVVHAAADLPLAWTYCSTPAAGWVVAYYVLGAVLLSAHARGFPGRRAAAIYLAGLLAFTVATLRPDRPGTLELTALDVQHGTAALLHYPDGSTVLYDCGTYARTDVGQWTVAPALWDLDVRRIDVLLVSHADLDHMNGLPGLVERFPIGRVITSPVVGGTDAGRALLALLAARGIPHETARAGDRIEFGHGNVIEVLAPLSWTLRRYGDEQNANSLVVRASWAGQSVLLAGDIEEATSLVLRSAGVDLAADVLLVPHHGCAMEDAAAFARAVSPRVAVCSNRADHLSARTVAAWREAGAEVFATCWSGAVTVRLGEDGPEVRTFLKASRESELGTSGGLGPPE